MASIPGFQGLQYPRSVEPQALQAWNNNNYQYATSSHEVDHDMHPALIVQPADDNDIKLALEYAKQKTIAVAVKSGGHQYSGASSTYGPNIQIDLKMTYKDLQKDLFVMPKTSDKTLVYASVSWSLGEFNGFLTQNGLFVPHGQCTDVRLGGHVQTGGYGQLVRSFGLLGDHVKEIRLIDSDAKIKVANASENSEIFYAILGGSPGNFGVIIHYAVEVHRDSDYDFTSDGGLQAHGLKAVWLYNQATVEALLGQIAKMAEDPTFARNYDLCVSVLSSDFPFLHLIPELDGVMKRDHPEIYGLDGMPHWPPMIILYAQWIPLTKDDRYSSQWFEDLADAGSLRVMCSRLDQSVSQMTGEWLFRQPREFDHPYVKRTYTTNSTTLDQDDWPKVAAAQIAKVLHPSFEDIYLQCWLSCQVQCIGGKNSAFYTNANNGTVYSWRDTTVVLVLDLFHESSYVTTAEDWQKENDAIMIGPTSCFSKKDRRLLWASYGDWNLDKNWRYYFEDQAKYEKLQKARADADPRGMFTPNPFAVQRAGTSTEGHEE